MDRDRYKQYRAKLFGQPLSLRDRASAALDEIIIQRGMRADSHLHRAIMTGYHGLAGLSDWVKSPSVWARAFRILLSPTTKSLPDPIPARDSRRRIDRRAITRHTMTKTEQRNLEMVDRWEDTYNNAVDRMVDECYAQDCEVHNMFAGTVYHGRAGLRAIEHEIQKHQVDRRLRVLKKFASGDSVAVECEGIFGALTFKACVILTFNAEGQIISDHTYSPDPTGITST